MKVRFLGVFILALFCVGAVWGADFSDEDAAFTLTYPDSWEMYEDIDGYQYGFVHKNNKAGVYIGYAEHSDGRTAFEFLEDLIKALKGKKLYDTQQMSSKALEAVGADDGAMCAVNYNSKKMGYLQTRAMGIYIKGDRIYILLQWLPASDLSKYQKDLGNIAKSFKIFYASEPADDDDDDDDDDDYGDDDDDDDYSDDDDDEEDYY